MISDDDLQTLDRATGDFEHVLAADGAVGTQPSRCPGWSARDVANHVLGGAIRYTHYFSGGSHDEVEWSRTADHLGDNPVEAHRRLAAALRREFVAHRNDDIVLHHRITDVDAPTLLVMRVQELVLHGWDIASVAEPHIELDPALCRFLLDRGQRVREILASCGVVDAPQGPERQGLTAQVLSTWGRGLP